MQTILTIIQFDWKQLSRSRIFWWLTVLIVCIGVYAAYYGRSEVKEQQQKIAVLKTDIDSSTQVVRRKLQKQDTIASWLGWYDALYALHSNKPDGLAALAFGQRDLHKFTVRLSIGTFFYDKYAGGYENKTLSGEIANPQQQATGHLDVSFVLVFLLPLYYILISYNLLSSEKEGGTLVLLAVQQSGIRRIIFIKLALRIFIAVVAGCMIVINGAFVNDAIGDGRLFYFLLATAIYILVWAGIVAFIISLRKSSGFNALSLIGCWLLFAIAMPAAFTASLNVSHPTGTKSDLAETVQKANARVWGTPRKELAKRFYAEYPQYNNMPGDTFPGSWYNPRWVRATHLLLDREVKPYEDLYNHKTGNRIIAADRLDYLSPVLLAQSIFNRTAASDAGQTFAYDTSIYHHFAKWRDYIDFRTYLRNNYLTKEEFEELPRGDFHPQINYGEITTRLLVLLATAVLLFILSFMRMNKNGYHDK